ncbi:MULTISPECIES: Ti-type conjugative transfer relaxase TraA [Bradyrhizobium]|jgi:Ti-type conjugative transfer relaxase TraA|uniref:Ti-type conjugative transfer relaxase TraA n=6 Tax=Bradyrhizobium TaxID=374 RepID=A0ABS5GCN9_9BRAD|nr:MULTISPECIES: Ti-type conjugative transfer relaxase TraA [Bradyrhizobium]MBR1138925.1 Ti-type conjugative transfer relaxase TraA [Bradyrhizobium denitrificans]MDU1497853.1 Ti-type conjugative transfer relaxase TraA [Bradyrhizobium sp.]MDU1548104.1 Ti-type conjugative transfer relaxase TraA [Bradyrhizobium sp.]MDU1804857.1 Ti-type conjugative transfer relaxase TraA [Bradyrhizobium sp.]MDU3096858.1 Ti-type conjugative transfer relaxase TraA [Bradyrhizobium sp.]
MAIYHLHVKVIGRKSGSSAVASAAYRSGSRLRDERQGRVQDFSAKRGVVHSEVMLPDNAPEAWSDRERLWNDVEAFEVRKDAQLAREVEFAIPREMSVRDGIELARDFVRVEFVDRGMIADLNVHWDMGEDGMPKPHAHVMLTMRAVDENGFGQKVRDWNRTEMVERWRERWAELANERLAELDIDARIDHRSLEAQGIALEPQSQIGAPAQRIEGEGIEAADRAEMHREIARNNGEEIIADPSVALDAITQQQSTFTPRDMARFAHRHSDGIDQFNAVMGAMRSAPNLVELGKDARGEDRFTTREMIEAEQRLHRAAELMAERERHAVRDADREAALTLAERRGLVLSGEQAEALAHVTDRPDLGVVVGHAGTGKSAMLGVAREAWEAAGYQVRGVALSGIAAQNLESGSGISSRTIASLEHGWEQGRDGLTSRDVLVFDEAGMVGTRQLERVLSHAAEAGAKVVLVGDPQQLQSIEAGAAFRSIHERHGGAEIGEVRRQRENWQRDATRDLATGKTGHALGAYRSRGMVHEAQTREQARDDLIDRWDRDRQASPDRSRIILTHTNDEVRALNEAARGRMRAASDLGDEVRVTVERGMRHFASGDRVMFLQNERGLGVKNGTLGTIEQVSAQSMTVQTDDGRSVRFDIKDYNRIDHGYAATIHKAQGMTVDRAHVLATPGMDAHSSYVALSRHRYGVDLHYGRDDFANPDRLTRTLSRDRAKDMASDYERADPAQSYAERRGITFRERVAEIVRKLVPEKLRDMFDGFRSPGETTGPNGGRSPEREAPERETSGTGAEPRETEAPERKLAEEVEKEVRRVRTRALVRHARAVDAIFEAQEMGGKASLEQVKELQAARKVFEGVRPYGSHDAEAAYKKDPELAREAASGRVNRAVRALQFETEIRIDPSRRADRFVERWQKLDQTSLRQYQAGDMSGYKATRSAMGDMAKSLERDPQLESILANRKKDLGIAFESGRRLGLELAFSHGIDLGRGRGIGI